jgi:hypothetical protein
MKNLYIFLKQIDGKRYKYLIYDKANTYLKIQGESNKAFLKKKG